MGCKPCLSCEIPILVLKEEEGKAIDFPGKWEEPEPWEGGPCQNLGPGPGPDQGGHCPAWFVGPWTGQGSGLASSTCHSSAEWPWERQGALLSLSPLTDPPSSLAPLQPAVQKRWPGWWLSWLLLHSSQIICSPPPNAPVASFTGSGNELQLKFVSLQRLFYWQMVRQQKV